MKVTIRTVFGKYLSAQPDGSFGLREIPSIADDSWEVFNLNVIDGIVVTPSIPSTPISLPSSQPIDDINMSFAVQHDGPDFRSWPATAKITRIDITADGVHVEFTKKDVWPSVTPLGWDGPLQYCLGMAIFINNEWHVSAPIQFWAELQKSGGNITEGIQVKINWFYDQGRWAPMNRQPQAGEKIGFFVVAGNVRGTIDYEPSDVSKVVRERSNVVLIDFPSTVPTIIDR